MDSQKLSETSMNSKKLKFAPLFLVCVFFACQQQEQIVAEWQLVFETDKDAKTVYGSKAELIELVRKGHPIRIGWESKGETHSVEHTIDVNFLTIANEKEVFAQLDPFWGQRPDLRSDTLNVTHFASQTNWILSTNGLRSSLMVDKVKDTSLVYPPEPFRYPVKWYAKIK